MPTFIATLVVIGLAMLAMAVGVMITGRALKGSCGGTGAGCPCTPAEREECRREAEERGEHARAA